MVDISDLTDLSNMGPHEIIFCWEDPNTRIILDFAIGRLAEAVERLNIEVYETPVMHDHAKFVRENRGIEEHRLASLRKLKVHPPVLMARMDDGSFLTLDGNHRYVIAAERKQEYITFQIVEPELWRKFIMRLRSSGPMPLYSGIG